MGTLDCISHDMLAVCRQAVVARVVGAIIKGEHSLVRGGHRAPRSNGVWKQSAN